VRRPAALAALVLVTACGGPQRPPDIGFKEIPSDVVLGGHATPTAAPVPTNTAGPALPPPPSVIALPPPTFDVGPEPTPVLVTPSAPPCPTANPLQAPAREAPSSISTPPVQGVYVFRNVGSYTISGADARKGTFPATSVRTVGNVVRTSDTSFTFDVSELLADVTTTTTYDVVGTAIVPAALPAGIYLKQVKSVRGQSSSTFAPSPELELAAFPLVRGASVTSSGVDAQSATSMQFTSRVSGKARVDACGTPLDSWVLELTDGKLISPTQNLDFSSTYNLGTEYGGLLLRERTAFAGTDGADGVSRTNTSNITTEPKTP
jgi:hypothetical protein